MARGLPGTAGQSLVPVVGGEELGELVLAWLTPTQAEGMTCRIGVHAVPSFGVGIRCVLEESCAEVHGAAMRRCWIGDVEIDVNLLRLPIGPIRRDVVRCMLHADEPVPLAVNDAVELRIPIDHEPVQHGSPECAFGCHVCCIEDDDVTNTVHGYMLRASACADCAVATSADGLSGQLVNLVHSGDQGVADLELKVGNEWSAGPEEPDCAGERAVRSDRDGCGQLNL